MEIEPENTQDVTIQPLGPNQEKWLGAIESGKFIQGRDEYLCFDSKYCCLGVGCKVLNILESNTREGALAFGVKGERRAAPQELIDKLDLFDKWGVDSSRDDGKRLSYFNDSGMSFVSIAKLIRYDPSRYFKSSK